MDARRKCFIEKMIKTILAKYVSPLVEDKIFSGPLYLSLMAKCHT
jgi:hypothetical protein